MESKFTMGRRPLSRICCLTRKRAMMKKEFTPDEIEYLSGLSAVATVTPTRIIYSEGFRRKFVHEYKNGKKPTAIFRDAGLPVVIIGRKRIERCTYRWIREGRYQDHMLPNDETDGSYSVKRNEVECGRRAELESLMVSLSSALSRASQIVDMIRDELHDTHVKASDGETSWSQTKKTGPSQ